MEKKKILDDYYFECKKIHLNPINFSNEQKKINFYINKFIDTNQKLIQFRKNNDVKNFKIYRLIIENARMYIYYYSLPFIFIPFHHKNNPITTFITSFNRENTIIKNKEDLIKYYKNVDNLKNKIVFYCERCIEGLSKGFSQSKRTIIFMIDQINNIVKSENIKLNVPESLKKEYNNFFKNTFLSIIKYFGDFLQKYKKYCRDTIGIHLVCKYSDIGEKMYKFLINKHLTINISPTEIHNIGIDEVKTITEKMINIKEKLGYANMDMREFYNSKIYKTFKNGDEIIHYFKKMSGINRSVINKYFYGDINNRAIIKKIPQFRNLAQIAYYVNTTGTFYINDNTDLLPICICKSLSLHEDSPGHHFQFQYMKENGVSKFLIHGNRNTAFIEGWGLYVETLGDYNDYELFGKYMEEKLRAIRLVIDTGIHYYGWSYEKALEYFTQNSLLPLDKLKKELERYIAIPAQALGYKIGERFFLKKQREWIEKGLDIKLFHKVILDGGILSLEILEHNIDAAMKK